MADQMAERVVAIQNAAEKSDGGSDCDPLATDPVLVRLLRLESDSCNDVQITWLSWPDLEAQNSSNWFVLSSRSKLSIFFLHLSINLLI